MSNKTVTRTRTKIDNEQAGICLETVVIKRDKTRKTHRTFLYTKWKSNHFTTEDLKSLQILISRQLKEIEKVEKKHKIVI